MRAFQGKSSFPREGGVALFSGYVEFVFIRVLANIRRQLKVYAAEFEGASRMARITVAVIGSQY
jgi:hypothetical protein